MNFAVSIFCWVNNLKSSSGHVWIKNHCLVCEKLGESFNVIVPYLISLSIYCGDDHITITSELL